MRRLQLVGQPEFSVKLNSDTVTIGSDPANDLALKGELVSDFHAEILCVDDGYFLVDLFSGDGTFVNHRLIGGKHLLQAWDRVDIGKCTLEVCDPSLRRPTDWALYSNSALLQNQFHTLQAVTIVGRGKDCDLIIDCKTLSRNHAQLKLEPQGVRVVDLGSANGTYLNEIRIQEAVAGNGDRVRFDEHSYTLKGPEPLSASDDDSSDKTFISVLPQ